MKTLTVIVIALALFTGFHAIYSGETRRQLQETMYLIQVNQAAILELAETISSQTHTMVTYESK